MVYCKQPRKEKRNGRKNAAVFSISTDNVIDIHSKYSKVKTEELIKPITKNQKLFVKSIAQNKYTFGVGMAGCGKTLLALYEGIKLLNHDESPVEKIYYVRANIDGVDEEVEIGSLPGEVGEKLTPLAAPIYDSCREFMRESDAKALFTFGKIEVLPTAYLRGRSFSNAYIIVDEAQNLKKGKIKTALTRLSHDSKMVLIGDPHQCDLKDDQKAFLRASQILYNDEDIGCIFFNDEDCMRNDCIARIVNKLDQNW